MLTPETRDTPRNEAGLRKRHSNAMIRALCDAEECWSQNRRAVTVITAGAKTS
jgi:hypothetical protein